MDNPSEEIKKKIDIVEFIGSYVSLKKTGRNFKGLCPFHNEKSPSFIVSPDRQIWHCFGSCGEGGDIFKFLMKWENITFFEALTDLAKKTGVVLKNVNFEDKVWKKKERYFNMNQLAAEFFQYILNKTKFGVKGLSYLKDRGINQAIIDKFYLGYAPNSWDSLRLFLKKKQFSDIEISDNGLAVKSNSGKYYDRFRGRLIFPILDSRQNIVGFSGRLLDGDIKEAKYVNTPETPIYHKRESLYGIQLAKESIKKTNNVYLVEGEFDMISPYQAGFNNFVAIKGSAVTSEQLMILKRYTNRLTLCLDSDEAGIEAAKRGIDEAERFDFEIMILQLSGVKDPDEAVRKDVDEFKKSLKKTMTIYDFIINQAKNKFPNDTAFDKKNLADEVVPYLSKIINPIIKSHYNKKLAKVLDVSESSIEELINKFRYKKKISSYKKPVVSNNKYKDSREVMIEKYLLSYLFQSNEIDTIVTTTKSAIDKNDFTVIANKKIYQQLIEYFNHQNKFNLKEFVSQLDIELRPAFDELYLYNSINDDLIKEDIYRIILEIKKLSLKRQINTTLSEEKDNNEKIMNLSNQLKEVEKKLL